MEQNNRHDAQQQTDRMLAMLFARTKAMELAVAAVIESHPNREFARAIWDRTHLDFADEAFDAQVDAGYQEEMAPALERWSRSFRGHAD